MPCSAPTRSRPDRRTTVAGPLLASRLAWALLAGLLATGCGLPPDAAGRVIRVYDGDSFRLATADGGIREVRIYGIDAPERHQPWSARAREALRGMLEGGAVRLEPVTEDAYGRTVARVVRIRDGLDAGLAMVRAGHAWVYDRYTDDPDLLRAQAEAREEARGLWALTPGQRVPPWEWRRRNRTGTVNERTKS